MLNRFFFSALFMLWAHGAQAVDTSNQEVILYSNARKVLLERGFHPYIMPGAGTCDEENPRCYPELVACKQKRHWICDYTWKSGHSIFQAETNSDVPIMDSFYCLVNCTAKEDAAAATPGTDGEPHHDVTPPGSPGS